MNKLKIGIGVCSATLGLIAVNSANTVHADAINWSQNQAETVHYDFVKQNADTDRDVQNNISKQTAVKQLDNTNSIKIANVHSVNTSVSIKNPTGNKIHVHYVNMNNQAVDNNSHDYDIDLTKADGSAPYNVPSGYNLRQNNDNSVSHNSYWKDDALHVYYPEGMSSTDLFRAKELIKQVEARPDVFGTLDNGDKNDKTKKYMWGIYGGDGNVDSNRKNPVSRMIDNIGDFELVNGIGGGDYHMGIQKGNYVTDYVFTDNTGNAISHNGGVVNVLLVKPVTVNKGYNAECAVSRTITLHFPNNQRPDNYNQVVNSNNQIVQTLTFTRTVVQDSLTNKILSAGNWQGDNKFPDVKLPKIPGFRLKIS